jgi:phenylalanyl-tRNA synthetase beta chain
MLVISDGEKALDIAGIKGGNISGVDENTTRVMLSAVNFNFENIRNTSKKLKLRTDASMRYENEVPVYSVGKAMNLFSTLMSELAEAKISENFLDTAPFNSEKTIIELKEKKINSVLGLKVSPEKVLEILNSLNIETEFDGEKYISKSPYERLDLNIPEDLIEEVGRIIGYDNLPSEMPGEEFNCPKKSIFKKSFYKTLDRLVAFGFYEINSRALSKTGTVELENPYTSELSFVRNNLLDKLREKVTKELTNLDEPKVFEINKVFTGYESKDKNKILDEHWSFAGILGRRKIKEKQKEELFFRTKGYLEKVFEILFVKNIS